ncbi:hypothetical protein FHS57_006184 [Runella defluvii]|uniref:Secretion system C-terminal sorting domain-containing protein n=1 Tax=Runella defluvii TaxID=370973 RepID=A0A7W5ZS79_9BACT|nr:choice-of-anchor Q domain-containing protein [Runella defluvii]MBB3842153.1 hypothetical protein [Runella defluvii]
MQKLFIHLASFLFKDFCVPTTASRQTFIFGSLINGQLRLESIWRQILLVLLFCGGVISSFAATITVTNGNDSGSGSFRNAVASAISGDIIVFNSSVTTVNLFSGEIAFGKNLTIDGGTSGVTINRSVGYFRLFKITTGTVTFNRINLTNGNSTDENGGGAIEATGAVTLNMTNCNITGNNSSGGGAAMVLSGPTTLTNCNISDNTTTNTVGHAILFYPPGNLTMTGCTVSNNTGNQGGAAVDLRGGAGGAMTVIITNCTISGNSRGGIITPSNECTITITNTTITNNSSGFENYTNKCTMKNTILADNNAADLYFTNAVFLSGSTNNILGNAGASGLVNGVNGNQIGVDPKLLPLASNGGFTQTHALSGCSPAINAGASTGAPSTDQRGNSRFGTVDIGAFEYQSSPSSISITSSVTNACNGNNGSIDLTVSNGTAPYTYSWSGSGSGTDPRTNLAAGTYNVTVTDNAGCTGTHSATVTNITPTTSNAGPNQTGATTCGVTQVTLSGNTPTVGTGSWSVVSGTGGTFGNANSPTSTFSGTAGSTYTLRWTITNGSCTSTDDVTITFNQNPTTSNAGPNQTGATTCGLTQVTLSGNTPTVGTGSWSVVSGTGGTFGNANSPTSTFSGTAGSTYTLRWTITNGSCTSTDDVTITFNQNPTTSNAGPNQTGATTCGLTQVTLSGNSPTVGTGSWSVVSGTGGTFGNANSPTSTFSGTAGSTYTLRWTITNGSCTSTDDVTITFNQNPTTSNAGPNQTGATTCGLTQVTLSGNTPTVGTGSWSVVSGTGGTFGTVSSPTSTFSGTAGGTYTLRWTITNGSCTSTDDVIITFNQNPTTSNAGPNQTGATTCGVTQVTLSGNTPTVGTGSWSVVSGTGGTFGNANSPTSTFSGTAGSTYTLRWTITNGSCTSTDDVIITFNQNPTTSNAGPDQTGATTCGITQVTLSGNTPTVGTGSWSVVSGTGGTFGNANSPTSTFSGTAGSTYTLRWTITNGSCTSTDDVTITFNQNPTTSNAGPNQTGATTCGVTQVTLSGNTPTVGTGSWSVVSGTGGTFGNANSPTSTFSGTAGSTYTLRWTITNGSCTSTDDVIITFNQNPTTSNAGPDQTGATTCGITQVTLSGNSPTVGTGSWSVVSGTGGTFGTVSSPTSTFSGTAGSTYTLRWTITNGSCTSTDDVIITFNQNPTTSNAGPDQTGATTCGVTQVTLSGNTPTVGTGSWSVVSGTGGTFGTVSSPTSTFSGTAGSTYTLRWTITNGSCTSTDDVTITFNQNPTTPTASVTVQPTCTTPKGTIVVTAPVGTGIEYSLGGTYQASATFSNLDAGNYNVTAKDVATGCISPSLALTVNAVPSAPAQPTASVTVQPTCTTPKGTIVVTAPTGTDIQYSLGGTYQASATFSNLDAGNYNVTAKDVATGCISTSLALTVNAVPSAPATPTASVTVQPTCTTPKGTIVVTAPVGTGIEYSLGGTYQTSATFSNLDAGNYNVTAKDVATGCISPSLALTVNAVPSAPAQPTASVTVQPTCTTPKGTIVVTAPVGTGIEYSLGGTYQTSATFSNLDAGNYNVTAKDVATGCISPSLALTVNAVPSAPAQPTASVTIQPTCTTPKGTIVVAAPVGTGIEYSLGGTYQTSATFSNLDAGNYNVTAKDVATGCISTSLALTVNAVPSAPAQPTASVTVQPTCTTPKGTIVVTAPVGTGIEYSLGGTYQASATFSNLDAGNYNVTAKDVATGCISTSLALTVNAVPSAPAQPTASVTVQPTCTTPKGTIVVTAPVGTGIEYSLGSTYQASATFSNLDAGNYNVTAKNTTTGCISPSLALTVNAVPSAPAQPTASVTVQPTCTTPKGTIVVTAPVGTGIEYSLGGTYQASATFSNLDAGNYNVTAKDVATGCISTSLALTVNAVPSAPAQPTASVTVQPTCTTPKGTIVVTAPVGTGIEYSLGSTYQASATFSNLDAGNYNVTAKNTTTGCISPSLALTVNAVPSAPVQPTASVTVQPTCTTPKGTIVVTAPVGTGIEYSLGGAYQTSATFSNLDAGNYNVTAKNTTTGCISPSLALTVNAVPSAPAQPTASVTVQPTCTTPKGTIVVTAPVGTGIEYSLGGTYQTSATFSNLDAGNYNVTAKDVATGCISPSLALTVNVVPSAPAQPTASVTVQPTCTTPKGTIVVTAPVGTGIEYSLGGTYQASATFSNLDAGNYNVTAKNTTTGCISTSLALTVNAVPSAPAQPTASVTVQPTCTTPKGTIVVTAPVGTGIEYSLGGTYQASATFSNLDAGNYNVTAKDVATGCISTSLALTVNAVPSAPAQPTASVTVQPTCTTPKGTIVVTAPVGTGIEYSLGGTYQASATFSNLDAGNYNVTAKDVATGCISTSLALTVNAVPSAPATPTASVTVQPTCTTPKGTIVVTAPVGTGIEYSLGGTYQASATFSNLDAGNYNVTAKNTTTGCISPSLALTVNAVPSAPAQPTASVTVQPTCTTPKGTIVVTAPIGTGIEYSLGGTYQTSATFSNLDAGNYNVTAKNTTTGCISTSLALTVNAVPSAPAQPTASVTVQPTCTTPQGTIVVTAPVGTGIEYSLGGTYQTSATFSNLDAGNYNVTAKNTTTGCISPSLALTVNAVPSAPATPTASVTVQPTCTTPKGTIVVTAPVGTGIEYSLGGTYQTSPTFSNLDAGNYNVTAKNTTTGCISPSLALTVNAVPSVPAQPTVGTLTQPTCALATGSVELSGLPSSGTWTLTRNPGSVTSTGTGGTTTVSGLVSGIYTFTVTNDVGCTSGVSGDVEITVPPSNVSITTAASAPICAGATSFTIPYTATTGSPITYSITGVGITSVSNGTLPSTPIVVNLSVPAAGNSISYSLVVSNAGGCVSPNVTGSVAVQNKPTITLTTLQQTLNEGNNPVLCDTDANPVNGLQFGVSSSCVSGSPIWRVQVGSSAWSDWSTNPPVSQLSNNQLHRYQAACDANCASTYSGVIELTINNRASVPQNVSLLVDGVTVAVGETKEVCSLVNMPLTFNANCATGEVILYSIDGGEYSSGVPVGLVDNQYHNYRVRCRKSDGTPSCVESESGVMRLKLVVIPSAPTVSLSPTSSCNPSASFSGQSTCGSLRTVWYNATTNVALPSLPATVPTETTSYYARCQTENGCVSEKSNVVTFTLTPTQVAPVITASQEIVCTGTTVTISANCPAGSQTFWNTGVTAPSFEVAFNNVTKQTYWAKCLFEGGCQSAESIRKDIYWNAFVVTLINIGQSKSAVKPTNDKSLWSSQFITRDGGPELEQSTQVNPTLFYVENANKMAPRYWTINVEACGLSTDGSLTFDMLATPEMGIIRSFNTHENNAPYFMYANREGWTELYAQNHPAYGFYQDNGAGGNVYDSGLPKGLYKLGIRYWDQKGWGSIYPSTRQPQGNVLAYQEYWFRIQSKDGVGVGAARTADSEDAKSKGQGARGEGQGSDNGKQLTDNGAFATVLPNPVTSILRLKVQESKGQTVQAALTDATGREVLRRQFVPETNTHQEEFGVSELASGVYFLRVQTENKQEVLKVLKVN